MSSSGAKLSSEYSLEIPLPEHIEREFRAGISGVPGATWPRWGGHITVLNRFVPTGGLDPVVQVVQRVCAARRPFLIHLDEVLSDRHWRDPRLNAVMLVSGLRDEEGYRALAKLHNDLEAELALLKQDVHPELSGRGYVPHLSLTLGVPEPDAARLLEMARASGLEVEFTVENICLLEFVSAVSGEERMGRVQSFPLAAEST
jgi:hypothetical protein